MDVLSLLLTILKHISEDNFIKHILLIPKVFPQSKGVSLVVCTYLILKTVVAGDNKVTEGFY